MKTYLFKIEFQEEEDGRWSVWVPDLPGCTTWGNTKKEAVENIKEAFELYIEDVIEAGDKLPESAEVFLKSGETRLFDYPSLAIAV